MCCDCSACNDAIFICTSASLLQTGQGGMAIEKRISTSGKVSYRARLRLNGRTELSSTHQRLTDARDWEARARSNLKSRQFGGQLEAALHTAEEAVDRYLELL